MFDDSDRYSTDDVAKEDIDLTRTQRQDLRKSLNRIRVQANKLLGVDYEVGVTVEETTGGTSYAVSVLPPVGYPVKFEIDITQFAEHTDEGTVVETSKLSLDEGDCDGLAKQLVASAIAQTRKAEQQQDDEPFAAS